MLTEAGKELKLEIMERQLLFDMSVKSLDGTFVAVILTLYVARKMKREYEMILEKALQSVCLLNSDIITSVIV
ncbi:hypothetical protein D8674_026942 [Pyrus ussuriensis x Pyrus communis]|uniref:Uncharacterized protein n=1 Tax=Pyrus ussuriensis x Pyrus communis TaxID=2448454 RepID=A0A5N5I9D2_9ROSA|nr:hypothetical protein D8674_026942 [Pyrus ussuriensis x Pyrus communis]